MRKRPLLTTRLLEIKITIYKYLTDRKRPYLLKIESLYPDSTKEDHLLFYYETLQSAIREYYKQIDIHIELLIKQ